MKSLKVAVVATLGLVLAGIVLAEDSPAAKATRKRLQQKITVEFKDERTADVFGGIFAEMDKAPKYKIDTANGLSLNTKWTFKAKDKTVEQVLNAVCDKIDCGWFVVSNESNNKVDGSILIRRIMKGKERGHEAGKGAK
jgi:hypothetical protein